MALEPSLRHGQVQWQGGCAGSRVLHLFDHAGKAWYGALRARMRLDPPPWAHGSLEGRCRESAILVQDAMAWRARDCGTSALLNQCLKTFRFCIQACTGSGHNLLLVCNQAIQVSGRQGGSSNWRRRRAFARQGLNKR